MSIGFYLLCKSVYPEVGIEVLGILPVSMILGIVAIFSPGGLGVREGALTFLLVSTGIPTEMALSISIFSRVWTLIGEGAAFALSFILKKFETA